MFCPLCGSQNRNLVKSISVDRLCEVWEKEFEIDISHELDGLKQIELFECIRCQLKYFSPNSLVGSSKMYAQLENFGWYYMPSKWEYSVALRDLIGSKRILEIGSGYGHFIRKALLNNRISVEGIELNETAIQKAKKEGINLQRANLSDIAKEYPAQYDAVCSFQVLEHVPNPRDFIDCCCALVKPRGKIILAIPNADSFLKYQFNVMDMPPHHMTLWSKKVLNYFPFLFPLELEHISFEPLARYHINGYVEAYYLALRKYTILKKILVPQLRRYLSYFIEATRLNNLLIGQTLYVSFKRI
jgi:2-polyprenyl-3-methyl-5-hydroxy-6-metoxy-1,4-benzoquinol methylase